MSDHIPKFDPGILEEPRKMLPPPPNSVKQLLTEALHAHINPEQEGLHPVDGPKALPKLDNIEPGNVQTATPADTPGSSGPNSPATYGSAPSPELDKFQDTFIGIPGYSPGMSTRQTTMSPDCFVHLDDFGLPNPEPRDKGVAKPRRHSDASQIEGTSPADGIAIGKKARFKESYVYEVLTDDESDSEVQEERKQRKISPTSHFLSGMPRDVRLTRKAANQIMPKETRKASNEFGQIEHQNKQLEKAEKRLKPKKEPLMGPPKRKKSYKLTEPETDSQEDTDKARRQSQPPRKKAKEANRRATISNPYSLSVNEHLADKEHSGDMKLRNKNNRAREEAECGNIKTEYKETIINLNAEVKGLKDEVHSLTQQGHSLRLENSSLRQTQATMVAKLGRGEGNKDSRRKITELVNLMDATASAILGTDYKDPADIANLLEGGEMLQKRVKREREDGYGEGCHGFGEQTNSEYQSHDN